MKALTRDQTTGKCGSYNPINGCCKILKTECNIEKADADCEKLKIKFIPCYGREYHETHHMCLHCAGREDCADEYYAAVGNNLIPSEHPKGGSSK